MHRPRFSFSGWFGIQPRRNDLRRDIHFGCLPVFHVPCDLYLDTDIWKEALMPCNCYERNKPDDFDRRHGMTSPREPCAYCAEKHISSAAALAREQGYAGVNRGYVVGELVAACWHLNGMGEAADTLAAALRDLRHRIQSRREDETLTDFSPYLVAIDAIIRADMAAEESASES